MIRVSPFKITYCYHWILHYSKQIRRIKKFLLFAQSLTINSTNYLFLSKFSSIFLVVFSDQDNFSDINYLYFSQASRRASLGVGKRMKLRLKLSPQRFHVIFQSKSVKNFYYSKMKINFLNIIDWNETNYSSKCVTGRCWFIIIFITRKMLKMKTSMSDCSCQFKRGKEMSKKSNSRPANSQKLKSHRVKSTTRQFVKLDVSSDQN